MRILAAFLCMSLIGVVATVLAVISALLQMLPVLLIAAAVFGVLWWRRRAATPARDDATARPPAVLMSPAPRARPIRAQPTGWVLMPVWVPTPDAPERHHYIDAEIISEDNHRG
jgi:hypothetical protein